MTKEEAKKLVLTVRMALESLEDDTCVAAIEAKAEILKLVAQPVQPVQPNEADQLLTAMGLDPNTYRTDGGWLNIPKITAAIKSPQDYPHLEHVTDGRDCWCNPEVDYVDPDTGAAVIVHKEPN